MTDSDAFGRTRARLHGSPIREIGFQHFFFVRPFRLIHLKCPPAACIEAGSRICCVFIRHAEFCVFRNVFQGGTLAGAEMLLRPS